jgi:MSHA pilin protein MshD
MCAHSRGFTLVEIVVLIVVVAAALVGVLLVFQNTARGSADPQVRKQALAIAEAMLDEILQSSYDIRPGAGARADFDDVDDYVGFTTAGGMTDIRGTAIPGLENYNVTSITVDADAPLGGVDDAKRITVTVTGPQGFAVTLESWRLQYASP